jgi:hypothetical protein
MPSRVELLRHLWTEIIEVLGREDGFDNLIANSARDPNGPFADAGPAMERILATGASRGDLSIVLRSTAYDAVFSTLYALDDPGVADGESVLMLHEELLTADPSGREGRPDPRAS